MQEGDIETMGSLIYAENDTEEESDSIYTDEQQTEIDSILYGDMTYEITSVTVDDGTEDIAEEEVTDDEVEDETEVEEASEDGTEEDVEEEETELVEEEEPAMTATVTLSVTSYNLNTVSTKAFLAMKEADLTIDDSEEMVDSFITTYLPDAVADTEQSTIEVTLNMVQDSEGEWKIVNDDNLTALKAGVAVSDDSESESDTDAEE
jgi:hypothetical protein